jgi:hypothetical protein
MVRYRVTVANTGTAPFTEAAPAEIVDSVAGLAASATWNGDLLSTHGSPAWSRQEILWRGALAAGQSAVISYSLTLRAGATAALVNTACATASSGGECSKTGLGVPALAITKRIVGEGPRRRGQSVTFEVTAVNVGTGDFTESHPAEVRDNLAGVLDDSTFDSGSVSATVGARPVGTVHAPIGRLPHWTGAFATLLARPLDGSVLRWTGPLAAGSKLVLRYSVTYTGKGNHSLVNRACVPGEAAVGEACAYAMADGPAIGYTKRASVSAGDLKPGTVVAYTLHLVNAGDVTGVLDLVDRLADVLDDTAWLSGPDVGAVHGAGAASASTVDARVVGGVLSIGGRLGPHTSVDVVYRVKVTPGGNGYLLNSLAERGFDGRIPPSPSRQQCVGEVLHRDTCVLLGGESAVANTGLDPGTGRQVAIVLAFAVVGAFLIAAKRRPRRRPAQARRVD